MRWKELAERLIGMNWLERPQLYVLVATFLATRIPFLFLGFGADPDSWLVASSAYDLRYAGVYHASRVPGYPVVEIFDSLIIGWGWIATNSVTMILSLIATLVFAKILNDLKVQRRGLLVFVFAFFPILWKNSTNSMDYMWTLCFIIISWHMAIHQRCAYAGVMLGLAVGSRITAGVFIIPFIYLLWTKGSKWKDMLLLVLAAGAVAFVCFLPLIYQYGTGFLRYWEGTLPWTTIADKIVLGFGPVPLMAAAAVTLLSLKRLIGFIRAKDRGVIFLLMVVALELLLYARAPFEAEYLIPALPFLLLLFDKIAPGKAFVFLCALVVVTSGVSVQPDTKANGEIGVGFDGVIVGDALARLEYLDAVRTVVDANLSDHSVVVVGWYAAAIAYFDENLSSVEGKRVIGENVEVDDFNKDIRFVYILSLEELESALDEGRTLYYMMGMEEFTNDVYGYSLASYGGIRIG